MLGDVLNTSDAWIGMYLKANSETDKLWQDQSPIDFTLFAKDEPGSIEMVMNNKKNPSI